MEKFSYEANGYNRSEVNEFVKDVIKETEAIITRVKRQNEEIIELKKIIKHYENREEQLPNTNHQIEQSSESLKRIAQEESNRIISDAKQNASRIVNEALLKAEKIENRADILERNMKIFKRKLRIIMEQQMAVVQEIEVLELEP